MLGLNETKKLYDLEKEVFIADVCVNLNTLKRLYLSESKVDEVQMLTAIAKVKIATEKVLAHYSDFNIDTNLKLYSKYVRILESLYQKDMETIEGDQSKD